MSTSDIFIGFGLTVILAVGCQTVASKVRLPAIVLLLPVGFAAGQFHHFHEPPEEPWLVVEVPTDAQAVLDEFARQAGTS